MRRLLPAAAFVVALLPSVAAAQTAEGYVAGSVAGWASGSGSGVLGGVVGADINFTPYSALEIEGSLHTGAALGSSAGARVRFGRLAEGRRVPFITAGRTRVVSPMTTATAGWHVGGGIDLGFDRRRSVRLEVRDVIPESGAHIWAVRIGVSFR